VVLGPARYVPVTAEQEREAIAALARLLALVREQYQQQSGVDPSSWTGQGLAGTGMAGVAVRLLS
jgi:hypothetical protein